MHKIYNFSLSEKNFFKQTNIAKEDLVKQILSMHFNPDIFNDDFFDQFFKLANNYGIEATAISLLIEHDVIKNIPTFKQEYLMSAWKMLNKINTIFAQENGQEDNQFFENYILLGRKALKEKKVYLYIAMVFHIIKLSKKKALSCKEKDQFFDFLAHILPCFKK